jgi:KDO2-lipid IV(A) lauroyltransferase
MRYLRWLLELIGFLILSGIFCVLPRPWAHRLGRALGALAFHLSPRSREVSLENLQRFLGLDPEEARRVAIDALRMAGASLGDLLRAPRMGRGRFERDVEISAEVRGTLAEIRQRGRGAVLVTSHLGNWEFLNLCAPHLGLERMTVIVRPVPNPMLSALMHRYRSRTGQRIIYRSGAVSDCLRRVRAGEAAGITMDLPVPPGSGAEAVDFFGLPTFTTLAPAFIAAATGAPLMLIHLLPFGRHRYRLTLEGPFEMPQRGKRSARAREATRELSRTLEQAIRRHPECWAWWMKRWRIKPEGAQGEFPSYATDERHLWPAGIEPRRDPRAY